MEIAQILKTRPQQVSLRGWVYRHRVLGEDKVFLVIRDPTGIIQAVVKKDAVTPKVWETAASAYVESSVKLSGELKEDARAPGGAEIKVKEMEFISRGQPFPISKDFSEEFLLDVRHLWLRSRKMTAILKIRSAVFNYFREYLNNQGFYEVHAPTFTVSGCEGGSTLFEVPYFGKKAYLTQSAQLYLESMIYSLGRVYSLAPSFRAEKSKTPRHLTEFWHLEPEAAFMDFEANIKLQEGLIEYAVQRLAKEHADELRFLGRDPAELEKIKAPFPRMDYERAVEMVNELGGKMEYGEDFGADEEALISKEFDKPLVVHHYPKKVKAFYMREDPQKPGTVLNNDMLAPEGNGEIIGGSERIWDLDELLQRMREEGLREEDYNWYIDLRRYGSVPHSGFGLGVERFLRWVLKLRTVRDAIPYPRTPTRLKP